MTPAYRSHCPSGTTQVRRSDSIESSDLRTVPSPKVQRLTSDRFGLFGPRSWKEGGSDFARAPLFRSRCVLNACKRRSNPMHSRVRSPIAANTAVANHRKFDNSARKLLALSARGRMFTHRHFSQVFPGLVQMTSRLSLARGTSRGTNHSAVTRWGRRPTSCAGRAVKRGSSGHE
jgi:hypothetical protein